MYENDYQEIHRPQFHFSARRDFLNDPNGLVYYQGEYHLFFQYSPGSCTPSAKHWGHAVSADLVHWTELPIAIYPDELGEAWSGSAVVDWDNTCGLQTGAEHVLVALYTSCQKSGHIQTQSLAYSNDRGRTWQKHPKNPVLADPMRDPRIFRHRPTGRWIMALYQKTGIAFYDSSNLIDWSYLSYIDGFHECPDLFELPVDRDPQRTKWVLLGGDGQYRVGTFDGTAFHPESDKHVLDWGNAFYASQTWNDVPAGDGRKIQIAWANNNLCNEPLPGMPFNQSMTFPCKLSLRTFDEGIRICREPVREIRRLYRRSWSFDDMLIRPPDDPFSQIAGELFDWELELEPAGARQVILNIPGETITCDLADRSIHCVGRSAPLPQTDGRIRLRILVDRTFVEIFGSDERLSMSCFYLPKDDLPSRRLGVVPVSGTVRVVASHVHELESIWK